MKRFKVQSGHGSFYDKIYLVIGVFFLLVCSWMAIGLSTLNFTEIIICATSKDAFLLPQSLCRSYLYEFRGTPSDIRALDRESGLDVVFDIGTFKEQEALFRFLLSKGADINKLFTSDGKPPLHAAILRNDANLVGLLLTLEADPLVTDEKDGISAYGFLDKLDSLNPEVDMSAIRRQFADIKHR